MSQQSLVKMVTLSWEMIQQEKGTEQRSLLGFSLLQLKYMFWDQSVYVTPPQQPNWGHTQTFEKEDN